MLTIEPLLPRLGLTRGRLEEILVLGDLELHIGPTYIIIYPCDLHSSLVQAVDLAVSRQPVAVLTKTLRIALPIIGERSEPHTCHVN